uniref:DUF4939 domain-containing protein n=1 Tax=Cyprinodon variegatus TaxID=28743 RepID=A0A3Q2CT86_CYPVA
LQMLLALFLHSMLLQGNHKMAPAQLLVPEPNPPPRSEPVPSLPVFPPSLFSGESSECKSFLWQFFILSQLSGKAQEWKETRFSPGSIITCTFEQFLNEFTLVFSGKSAEAAEEGTGYPVGVPTEIGVPSS